MNPIELANNWAKITNLTKLAYPLVDSMMAHPNFLTFSLGDMYRGKIGILESLNYTFPDNGTWETDIEGLLLPKFIDAAITIKFVENIEAGSITGLYDFPKSNKTLTDREGKPKEASDTVSQHSIWTDSAKYDVSYSKKDTLDEKDSMLYDRYSYKKGGKDDIYENNLVRVNVKNK